MKKLLITSALASSLIASVAFAEVKIGGGLEITYGDAQTASTAAQKYNGTAIGYEAELDISASADLSNGMKVATHMEYISDGGGTATTGSGPSDVSIKVSSGALTLYIGQDDMEALDNNVVPKAYNLIEDNITSALGSYASGGPVAGKSAVGINYKVAGGSITYLYGPDTTLTASNGDSTSTSGGGSGYELSYVGSPIANLNIILGTGSVKASSSAITADTDYLVYGFGYQMGKFAVGASFTNSDAGTAATDKDTIYYGATVAVNDATTVGLQRQTYEIASATGTETTDQLEIAYNLGGMTAAVAYQKTDEAGSASDGGEADAYTITLKTSF
jgi:hypothetical protein